MNDMKLWIIKSLCVKERLLPVHARYWIPMRKLEKWGLVYLGVSFIKITPKGRKYCEASDLERAVMEVEWNE